MKIRYLEVLLPHPHPTGSEYAKLCDFSLIVTHFIGIEIQPLTVIGPCLAECVVHSYWGMIQTFSCYEINDFLRIFVRPEIFLPRPHSGRQVYESIDLRSTLRVLCIFFRYLIPFTGSLFIPYFSSL